MVNSVKGVNAKPPIVLTNEKTTTNPNEISVPVGQSKTTKNRKFREMRLDETYEQYKKARVEYYFKNDIKSGKLEYIEPTKVFGKEFGGRYFIYQADEGMTLGDIKAIYNLSDGDLGNQSPDNYGGDIDRHKANKYVRISEAAMEKALERKILHKEVKITD